MGTEVQIRESPTDGSTLFNWGEYDTVRFLPRNVSGPHVCVSVQRGCALRVGGRGCLFCSTGKYVAYKGSLTDDEIVTQVGSALAPIDLDDHSRIRVVFAGMGDCVYNPDGVVGAMIKTQNIFIRHQVDFVLATVGVPLEDFRKLRKTVIGAFQAGKIKKGTQVYLQLSLHAATTGKRAVLIPPAKDCTIEQALEEARGFVSDLRPHVEPIFHDPHYPDRLLLTLNYVMLGEKSRLNGNHTDADLAALIDLVDQCGKGEILVRLSAYNPDRRDGGHSFAMVGEEVFAAWLHELERQGIRARRFQSEGRDVRGGCGQMIGDLAIAPALP